MVPLLVVGLCVICAAVLALLLFMTRPSRASDSEDKPPSEPATPRSMPPIGQTTKTSPSWSVAAMAFLGTVLVVGVFFLLVASSGDVCPEPLSNVLPSWTWLAAFALLVGAFALSRWNRELAAGVGCGVVTVVAGALVYLYLLELACGLG